MASSNQFINAAAGIANQGLTQNGAATYKSSLNKNVDLFFLIGNRNKDFSQEFRDAYNENSDLATRILLWARDPRGGAGERATFRTILRFLEKHDFDQFAKVLAKVPEIGRWDDVLSAATLEGQKLAANQVRLALINGDNLCAKWMPREHSNNSQKRKQARALANAMGLTPRKYRKLLASVSETVEQSMCAKDWEAIDYNKIPSLAAARYQKAFLRNDEARYSQYGNDLTDGVAGVKINAGAVYPYDVIKSLKQSYNEPRAVKVATAQWEALPNLVGDGKILPMVDVSGSMTCAVGGSSNVSCMDIATSLGLYLADKNTGAFKDTFVTFTNVPTVQHLKGDIVSKLRLMTGPVGYSTNLAGAFDAILNMAIRHSVPKEDMPDTLLILSDMEFDSVMAEGHKVTLYSAARRKYHAAGYPLPKVVFWNLNSRPGNNPVKATTNGTALVSGFSPNILKAILSDNLEDFSPESVMLKAVMIDKYIV